MSDSAMYMMTLSMADLGGKIIASLLGLMNMADLGDLKLLFFLSSFFFFFFYHRVILYLQLLLFLFL